ncbi:hypothetical protein Plhal304r1_c020g0070371 [Plasmopara halstedii]
MFSHLRPTTTDRNSRLYHKQLDLSLMQRLQMADAGCDSRIKTADSKNNTRLLTCRYCG